MVKLMGAETAVIVPPAPYMPPAGCPGLVTVTCTVPGVAMADAGIVLVSWPPLTKVVPCFEPFQLMVASELKLEPLTVSVNPGSPEFAVLGTSCITTGTAPACGAAALGELYPPQPDHRSVSNNTESIFESIFMTFSSRAFPSPDHRATGSPECQTAVILL